MTSDVAETGTELPTIVESSAHARFSELQTRDPALSWQGPWTSPFALVTGLFALVLFAFLAAVYLTVEAADDREVREAFRVRALAAGVLAGALALATFVMSDEGAPMLRAGLTARAWSLPLHVCTGLAAVTALVALARRRFQLARIAAAAQVALIVLGWGGAQFPYLVAPTMTLQSAAAPVVTQRFLLWTLVAGAVVLLPSLWVLFRIFKASPEVKA